MVDRSPPAGKGASADGGPNISVYTTNFSLIVGSKGLACHTAGFQGGGDGGSSSAARRASWLTPAGFKLTDGDESGFRGVAVDLGGYVGTLCFVRFRFEFWVLCSVFVGVASAWLTARL